MKKLIIMLCAVVMGLNSMLAQNETTENLQWEAVVGVNNSDMGDMGDKIGFHLGARAEIALPSVADGVYMNAGALISLKGCELDMGDLGGAKTNAYYLEIPIHIGYKHIVNENLSIYGEVGPYIAYGIGGKTEATEVDFDMDYDYEVTTNKSNTFGSDGMKRFDIGAGLRFGVEIKNKYTLSIGYDKGFIDTYNSSDDSDDEYTIDLTPSLKNTNLTFSFGYRF